MFRKGQISEDTQTKDRQVQICMSCNEKATFPISHNSPLAHTRELLDFCHHFSDLKLQALENRGSYQTEDSTWYSNTTQQNV